MTDELDGVVAAPDHHKVIFENEAVRVLEVTIRAGDTTPLHTHLRPTLNYVVSGSHLIRRDGAWHRVGRHADRTRLRDAAGDIRGDIAAAHDREPRAGRPGLHRGRAEAATDLTSGSWSICATRAPEMPRISPTSRVDRPDARSALAALRVSAARSRRTASALTRWRVNRPTSIWAAAGSLTWSMTSAPPAVRSSTSSQTASRLRACDFGSRQRPAEGSDVRLLELDDPTTSIECVVRDIALHCARPPGPRSHPRPNELSPWRSMLRRVPVGMSREWIGTTIDAPFERRHF